MKKHMSQFWCLIILCAGLLAILVFPTNARAEKTLDEGLAWLNQRVADNVIIKLHNSNAQCTDFVTSYMNYIAEGDPNRMGQPFSVKMGYAYYDYVKTVRAEWERIDYYPGFIPQPGDIICWGAGFSSYGTGHVAVAIDGSTAQSPKVVQQDGSRPTQAPHVEEKYGYKDCQGVIRPKYKNSPAGNDITPQIIDFGFVRIKSVFDGHSDYVCAENNATIHFGSACTADSGVYETTRLTTQDGQTWVGFRATQWDGDRLKYTGNWIIVGQDGYLTTTGTSHQGWESFTIYEQEGKHYLLSHNANLGDKKLYVQAQLHEQQAKRRLKASGTSTEGWEQFQIERYTPAIESIYVKNGPDRFMYEVGDTIETDGMVVMARWNNRSETDITKDITLSETTLSTAGSVRIGVSFQGKTAEESIIVEVWPSIMDEPTLMPTTPPASQKKVFDRYINDYTSGSIPAADAAEMSRIGALLYERTGIKVVFVYTDSLEGLTLSQYADKIADQLDINRDDYLLWAFETYDGGWQQTLSYGGQLRPHTNRLESLFSALMMTKATQKYIHLCDEVAYIYGVDIGLSTLDYLYEDIDNSGVGIVWYRGGSSSVTIPSTIGSKAVTTLNSLSFCRTDVTDVRIPSSVRSIDSHAFSRNTALQSVVIPITVTSIGEKAFEDCSNLTLTVYPGSVAEQYAIDNGIPYIFETPELTGGMTGSPTASESETDVALRYASIIEQYRQAVLNAELMVMDGQVWPIYMFDWEPLANVAVNINFFEADESMQNHFGYAFRDLNNDGQPEMILLSKGLSIYAFVSLSDEGEPVFIGLEYPYDGGWGYGYYLKEDNTFIVDEDGPASACVTAYRLSRSGEHFEMDYEIGYDTFNLVEGGIYYKKASEGDRVSITEAEYNQQMSALLTGIGMHDTLFTYIPLLGAETEPMTTGTPDEMTQHERAACEIAYADFIASGNYLRTAEYYPDVSKDYSPIVFALHDMNADGMPELLIYNGSDDHAGNGTHVYCMGEAGVQFLGTIWGGPNADDPIGISTNLNYPGIFLFNGGTGYYETTYYTIVQGKMVEELISTSEFVPYTSDNLVETRVTGDDGLYAACENATSIPFYPMREMLSQLRSQTTAGEYTDAYSAYYSLLKTHERGIRLAEQTWWRYFDSPSANRTVVVADILGDSTPELCFFSLDESSASKYSNPQDVWYEYGYFHIYTFAEGKPVLLLRTQSVNESSGNRFFTTTDGALYRYNTWGQEDLSTTYAKYQLDNNVLVPQEALSTYHGWEIEKTFFIDYPSTLPGDFIWPDGDHIQQTEYDLREQEILQSAAVSIFEDQFIQSPSDGFPSSIAVRFDDAVEALRAKIEGVSSAENAQPPTVSDNIQRNWPSGDSSAPMPGFPQAAAQTQPLQSLPIASASSPTHQKPIAYTYGPDKVLDASDTTSWQYSARKTSGNGYKTYIILQLATPSTVETMLVKNGFWAITSGIDQYWRNHRVKDATITFQYAGSTDFVDPVHYSFADEKQPVSIDLGGRENVTAILFQIESIYTGNKFDDVAVTQMSVLGYPGVTQTIGSYVEDMTIDTPSVQASEYTHPAWGSPSFPTGKKYPVYSGPGTHYYRAANGKALVSTNEWIHVFGFDGDWALIEYSISAGTWRRGYIERSSIPSGTQLNDLQKANTVARTVAVCEITDDPTNGRSVVSIVADGTDVLYLFHDGEWAYVEVQTDIGMMRGYVRMANLTFL